MMNAYESTMNFTRRAVWAQIDLDAAAHNMRQIRKHVGPDVKIAAVVKANAYGHGAVRVSAKSFRDEVMQTQQEIERVIAQNNQKSK